jgi:L-rhamnose mutarotase
LKGSLHKRETKKVCSAKTVRKDLNFLRDTDIVMRLSPSVKSEFKRRVFKDKEFLKQCGLMDYSLLLIVFSKKVFREVEDQEEYVNIAVENAEESQRKRKSPIKMENKRDSHGSGHNDVVS